MYIICDNNYKGKIQEITHKNICSIHVCVAEVLCYGGGSGGGRGGGDGTPGISGKGGRSAKEGDWGDEQGCLQRSRPQIRRSEVCGTHRAGEKVLRCMRCGTTIRAGWRWGPTYSVEVGLQSATVARPQLRERTAVRPWKQSLRRVYLKGRAQKYFVGGGGEAARRVAFTASVLSRVLAAP